MRRALRDGLSIAGKLAIAALIVAGVTVYSCNVYQGCREMGGGVVFCLHMMGR